MAGWFNTNWNIADMFNTPSANLFGFGQREPDWMNAGAVKDTTPAENPIWGAPSYYQEPNSQGNMFENPYYASGSGGGYYNPYQFGQVGYPSQYGTQYGGSTDAVPWWMNYNPQIQQQQLNLIMENSLR